MNKIIIGVGLLICGVLGDFTRNIDIVIALIKADPSVEPLREAFISRFRVFSELAPAFVVLGAVLGVLGLSLPIKSRNGTKIAIISAVLLMCGMFGDFTNSIRNLFTYASFASAGIRLFSPLSNTMLSDFTLVFIVAGTILCAWGLADRDENETKKVVLGAGLLVCGVVKIFFRSIMGGILSISPARTWEQFPELGYFETIGLEHALIISGIAFSIWGLIKKGKKEA